MRRTALPILIFTGTLGLTSLPAAAHPQHTDEATRPVPIQTDPAVTVFPVRLNPEISIEVRNGRRVITANGVPDHATGRFPNRNNPNEISAQRYRFEMPLSPEPNDRPTSADGMPFGVALNGVPFDPGTAENWTPDGLQRGEPRTGWTYEALGGGVNLGVDHSNAHVQPTGAYHYHGVPAALYQSIIATSRQKRGPVLLGYAADGFPIYNADGYEDPQDSNSRVVVLQPSYRLNPGERPTKTDNPPGPGGRHDGAFTQDYQYIEGSGDLDECNGRFAVTPEYPDGTYHYVLTEAFPHIPRFFHGTPDDSFQRRRGRNGPRNPGADADNRDTSRRGNGPPPDGRRPPPR